MTISERLSWKHTMGFEVEMSFDGKVWQCRCQDLDIETTIQNQAAQDLDAALEDWINTSLAIKPASQIVAPPKRTKTIWGILSRLIGGDLVIGPRQEKVIFQKREHSVSLFHDRDGRLRLVARNGLTTTSPPIAHNPMSASAGEWHLVRDAQAVYDAWVETAKNHKPQRPLWHHRPAVDALMRAHGVGRDEAAAMWTGRGGSGDWLFVNLRLPI